MPRILRPDLRLHRVEQIDVDLLRRLRIEALLLDVDCTLKAYRAAAVSQTIIDWVHSLRGGGIGLCLVSNGRAGRVQPVADALGVPLVALAAKPLPRGCREAVKRLGLTPARTAMVGDQLFTDVIAGRLAGVFTILVEPIRPEQEPWYTRLKRPFERVLIHRIPRHPQQTGPRPPQPEPRPPQTEPRPPQTEPRP